MPPVPQAPEEQAVPEPTNSSGQYGSAQRVLDAAIELVAEHGEKGLRISDVVQRSKCSNGTVYHFYGSRARLLEAVRATRFSPVADSAHAGPDLQVLRDALEAARGPAEMMVPITQFVQRFSGAESTEELWRMFDLVSLAHSKPGIRKVVADSQRLQTERYSGVFALLQEKGMLDPELDPWATSVFIQAFMIGRLLGLIDGTDNLDPDAWSAVVMRFVSSIVAK